MQFCSILNSLAFSIVSFYASKCFCLLSALISGSVEGFVYASALISNCFSLIYSGVFALLGSVFTTHCHLLNLSQANLFFICLINFILSIRIYFPLVFLQYFYMRIRCFLHYKIALLAFHQLFAYSTTALLLSCFPLLF